MIARDHVRSPGSVVHGIVGRSRSACAAPAIAAGGLSQATGRADRDRLVPSVPAGIRRREPLKSSRQPGDAGFANGPPTAGDGDLELRRQRRRPGRARRPTPGQRRQRQVPHGVRRPTRRSGRWPGPSRRLPGRAATYWFSILREPGRDCPGRRGRTATSWPASATSCRRSLGRDRRGTRVPGALLRLRPRHGDPATGTGDLVIRYRNGTGYTTADAILVDRRRRRTRPRSTRSSRELDVNVSGATDDLTYWVNPTDFSSQAALDASASVTNVSGGRPTSPSRPRTESPDRLRPADLRRRRTGPGRRNFDEVRLGTTLADVVPSSRVPELPSPSRARSCLVGHRAGRSGSAGEPSPSSPRL